MVALISFNDYKYFCLGISLSASPFFFFIGDCRHILVCLYFWPKNAKSLRPNASLVFSMSEHELALWMEP